MARRKKKKQAVNLEPRILNRRATHDYTVTNRLECGIQLLGSEVKSVRAGTVNLAESFVQVDERSMQLLLVNADVALYPQAGVNQHQPRRTRKLLAHKREIKEIFDASNGKGVTVIPLSMYFVRGMIKVEIGVGAGKKQHDKRDDLKARQAQRDIQRGMTKRVLR